MKHKREFNLAKKERKRGKDKIKEHRKWSKICKQSRRRIEIEREVKHRYLLEHHSLSLKDLSCKMFFFPQKKKKKEKEGIQVKDAI